MYSISLKILKKKKKNILDAKITLERENWRRMKEFLWIWVAILGTISRRKNREGELTQSWAWRSVGGKLRRVSFGGGAGQEYRRNH